MPLILLLYVFLTLRCKMACILIIFQENIKLSLVYAVSSIALSTFGESKIKKTSISFTSSATRSNDIGVCALIPFSNCDYLDHIANCELKMDEPYTGVCNSQAASRSPDSLRHWVQGDQTQTFEVDNSHYVIDW